ncbi:putative O-linked N-acetylglucosamine transferase (SPINDLY family) [Azospirillum lipoferum]|uniref:protein O-GlcNAc transferase n=1 Tax=Azospirillum lipoferum TaxID=193 RepID=A0A5A9GKF7_AZOLI|nr:MULTISPECIES: tetratricopeptide repeat protein [Azospirillum]KAA0593719.1 tetratricopeptide repeat protein [Azospirillum lipoferum]MCP1615019.1 putative O-linked N-acetylglucosamine transferase (SPINDLY family) [Azospirillum lipoferum]MDW5536924.1 tetratricopeptide repeat protein [Azospirillum sp. NL1]
MTPPTQDAPDGLKRRALEAFGAGRLEEAAALCRALLALDGTAADVWNNLGVILSDLKRPDEAAAALRTSLAVRPEYEKPWVGLGSSAYGANRLDEAVRFWSRATVANPRQDTGLWFNLGVARQMRGEAAAAALCFDQAERLAPADPLIASQRLLCLNYLDLSGERLLAEHRRFDDRFGMQDGKRLPAAPHANRPDPERRLRIGYLSVEFREHLGAYFLTPLFEAADRSRFEIVCYSILPDSHADAYTARFKAQADGWRTVGHLNDEALAAQIRADGIDILVDLAGHSGLNRLPMLARRPAPVQVTWLGYPNGTGMESVGYRIVDPVSDPVGPTDAHAVETLVRLPPPFLCFRPPASAPPVVPLPAGATGAVTFGSFNKLSKITDGTVALWAGVLRRVPDARLLLKDRPLSDPGTAAAMRARFAATGIDPARLDLVGFIKDAAGHLAAYNRIDIALDPHPYNGTITTCDTLWMGAPLVTLAGSRHAARVGASLMAAIGLPELVATTPDQYAAIAAGLAGDLTRLMRLRMGMRERLRASALCDEGRFMRNLETAYRLMWRRWCDQQDQFRAVG